jgi:hypothetical protein
VDRAAAAERNKASKAAQRALAEQAVARGHVLANWTRLSTADLERLASTDPSPLVTEVTPLVIS